MMEVDGKRMERKGEGNWRDGKGGKGRKEKGKGKGATVAVNILFFSVCFLCEPGLTGY